MVSAGAGVTLLPSSAREVEARPGSGWSPGRSATLARSGTSSWRGGASSPLAALYRTFAEAIGPAVQEQCPLD